MSAYYRQLGQLGVDKVVDTIEWYRREQDERTHRKVVEGIRFDTVVHLVVLKTDNQSPDNEGKLGKGCQGEPRRRLIDSLYSIVEVLISPELSAGVVMEAGECRRGGL